MAHLATWNLDSTYAPIEKGVKLEVECYVDKFGFKIFFL